MIFLAIVLLACDTSFAQDLVCTVLVNNESRDVIYHNFDQTHSRTQFELKLTQLSLSISAEPENNARGSLLLSLLKKPIFFLKYQPHTLSVYPNSRGEYFAKWALGGRRQYGVTFHCRPLIPVAETPFQSNPQVTDERKKLLDILIPLDQEEFLSQGRTRLHWLSATAELEEVQQYFKQNPLTDLHQVDDNGNTALHFAYLLNPDSVGAELARLGANPDQKNFDGVTPKELKALGQGQVKIPLEVPFYNPETLSLEWIPHAEAIRRLGFFLTETPVASKWFYLENSLLPYLHRITYEAHPHYSTASLFFAPGSVGWAVHTRHDIEEGDYVGDYLGMLSNDPRSFPDPSHYILGVYHDDSKLVGGMASRVNTSSCQEGANTHTVWTQQYGIKTRGLVASRKIRAGEEILWFYAHEGYRTHCIPNGKPFELENKPALIIH